MTTPSQARHHRLEVEVVHERHALALEVTRVDIALGLIEPEHTRGQAELTKKCANVLVLAQPTTLCYGVDLGRLAGSHPATTSAAA